MAPKVKKCQSIWQECVNCSCIMNYKDIDLHVEYCQLPKSEWPYGFIDDKVLYGYIENFDRKGLPSQIREDYIQDMVFLSQSAMQLCGFPMGYPVQIEISGYKTVLKAWPTTEGSLTSVGVSLEELSIRSGLKLSPGLVKVSKLLSKPFLAKELYCKIVADDEYDTPLVEADVTLFSHKFKDKIVQNNMFLMIPFYGKKIKLKINKITNLEEDILNNFEQMNLNVSFYIITEHTVWINEESIKALDINKEKKVKIGGYGSLLHDLTQNISFPLNQTIKERGRCSSYSVLLYGPSGTGKSLIAQHLADGTEKPVINIQGSELFSKFYGETENRLRNIFQDVKIKAPCVVIIDNVETLGTRKGNDQERRVLSTLLSLFDSIRFLPVIVIATTVDPDVLDPSLRRPGRLEAEVEVNIPNQDERLEILKSLISDVGLCSVLEHLAANCHGYTGADLSSLVDKAVSKIFTTGAGDNLSAEHLMSAFTEVRPSAMRELQISVPAVRWEDIGGGHGVRLRLEQAVEWPLKHGDSLKRLGIKAPKGVLLYGPPGCSKTLTAKALATETNLNFISIKGSDVFSKWVGESEKALRDLFRSARKVAPAIIFIDEVDALGANRGSSMEGNTVHDRVLSQLLTEMDGINPLEGVVIVAATNRPDCMDKALLRPGRLDRLIYVPLPDYETRLQIIRIRVKKIPTKNFDIEEIAKRTVGYSGAEVVAVCTEAALAALVEDMNAEFVEMKHFIAAIASVPTRTPQSLLKLYDDYRKQNGHC